MSIFDVFMPLIYGEGDNALQRLQKEINDQFGSDIAARLGGVNEVRSEVSYRKRASPTDANDFVKQASEFDQMVRVLRPSESRPAKRVRTSYDAEVSRPSNGRSYGNTTINTSHIVIMGDHVQHPGQSSQYSPMPVSEDKYYVLLKSLLFDRIDFRVNNVKKALLSTC